MARIDELIGYGTHAARPAAGSAGALYYETDTDTLFRDNGSTWDAFVLGGGGTLSTVSNHLSANVAMPSANTYYDGPSVSCAAGTWLLCGVLTVQSEAGNYVELKLWDGSTVAASTEGVSTGATNSLSLPIVGLVTPSGTTTYKVSAAASVGGSDAKILAAAQLNAAGNTASTLVGVKVA